MVELLVVLGIMVALMAILIPTVSRAYKNGIRSRMEADLQVISIALEAYNQDFRSYPRFDDTVNVPSQNRGAYWLCRALLGPENANVDSADGLGFRTKLAVNGVPQGKVWGPYLAADRFKVTAAYEIGDRYGKPILYYSANKEAIKATSDGVGKYVAAGPYLAGNVRPYYNANDNTLLSETVLQNLLGAKNDGTVQAAAFTGPFILWSAGPDQLFGPQPNQNDPVAPKNPCDDVANFPRSEY